METRQIDSLTEVRIKELNDYYYKYLVVTYDRQRKGEYNQKYYTANERDAAYADFNNR